MSERCERCSVQEPPNYSNAPRENHPDRLQNGAASSLLPSSSSSHLPFIFPHAWKVLITRRALMARRKCPAAIPARSEPCPVRGRGRGARCDPAGPRGVSCGRDPIFLSPPSGSFISGVQLKRLLCPQGGCAGFVNLWDGQTVTSLLLGMSTAVCSCSLTFAAAELCLTWLSCAQPG